MQCLTSAGERLVSTGTLNGDPPAATCSPPCRGPFPPWSPYLNEENRVYRELQGGKRPRFSNEQRRRLAANDKALGRSALSSLDSIVSPDTLLRWYRQLIARKYDGSRKRGPGRPRRHSVLTRLILHMARENPSGGTPASATPWETWATRSVATRFAGYWRRTVWNLRHGETPGRLFYAATGTNWRPPTCSRWRS